MRPQSTHGRASVFSSPYARISYDWPACMLKVFCVTGSEVVPEVGEDVSAVVLLAVPTVPPG